MDYYNNTFNILKDHPFDGFGFHSNTTTIFGIALNGLMSSKEGYDNNIGGGTTGHVTDAPTYYPTLKHPIHRIVLYSVAYALVFLLGILGNSLVVLVVYRNPRMHNVTNYFIVNLAVADMLVCLFCLPITLLSNLYSGWRFGAVLCKVTPFLQGVAVSASVNTLAAIAIDRYLAICHLLKFRMTRKAARIIIIFIWIFAGGIMTPWAVYYEQRVYTSTRLQTIYICDQFWPSEELKKGFFLGAIFLTCYTLPLILISVCYLLIGCKVWHRNAPGVNSSNTVIYRSKVKALKMLIVVVVLFSLSWLPLYMVNMRMDFGQPLNENGLEFALVSQVVVPVAQWLGSSNSCVNPVIYCFFSKKFRHGFKRLVKCASGKKRSTSVTRNNSALYFSVNCNGTNHSIMYTNSHNSNSPINKMPPEDTDELTAL